MRRGAGERWSQSMLCSSRNQVRRVKIAWIFTHVRYEKAPRAREAMHGPVR